MKELSIEEKAKAYDELFVKAKQIYNKENDVLILHTIEDLFPELKDEDERIRKTLVEYFGEQCDMSDYNGVYAYEALAWLEKQGKQNITWSEEDERNLEFVIRQLRIITDEKHFAPVIDWLKSLKDKVQPQPQPQWSKEDERNIQTVDSVLFYDKNLPEDTCMRLRNWLKSLRHQNVWNPSKEQMYAINVAINILGKGTLDGKQLIKLQEQLKRLKRE